MFVCFFNSFTSVVRSVWAISQRYYTINGKIIIYTYICYDVTCNGDLKKSSKTIITIPIVASQEIKQYIYIYYP